MRRSCAGQGCLARSLPCRGFAPYGVRGFRRRIAPACRLAGAAPAHGHRRAGDTRTRLRDNMHKPVTWPLERATRVGETAPALSQAELLELEDTLLLARRHRALHQPTQDLRQLRGLVPLRRGGPPVPRPADVVFGRQFRLPQRASQPRGAATSWTGCRRWPASTCIARRSSWPPSWPRPPSRGSA